jgi:hypothetical protein
VLLLTLLLLLLLLAGRSRLTLRSAWGSSSSSGCSDWCGSSGFSRRCCHLHELLPCGSQPVDPLKLFPVPYAQLVCNISHHQLQDRDLVCRRE